MFHQHLKLNVPETELKPKQTGPSPSVPSECQSQSLEVIIFVSSVFQVYAISQASSYSSPLLS